MMQATKKLVTRFAPSPTGYLHLGHALSALYVWGMGRHLGAAVLLRIEDHDQDRSRPEYEDAILADLSWLGLVADNQSEVECRPSRFRQSDCEADHEAAIQSLARTGHVYACDCTRKQIAAGVGDDPSTGELRYLGRCRERNLSWDGDVGLRLAMPNEEIAFHDLMLGEQRQNPAAQCGDILLKDRHRNYTYQLAVVADDLAQGVNLVIRGQDLAASTARQIALARRLGRKDEILFAHHALIVDADGRKLGKRFLSEALAKRRVAGERPEDVLGEAAFLGGLQPTKKALSAQDLPGLFQGKVNKP